MPRMLNRLSARTVASLKEPGLHADGAGLYLRVDPEGRDESDRVVPGAKRWVFIFQWERRRKEMGLGSARVISLAEARDKALAASRLVAAGKNPILVRRGTEVGVPTFGDVADDVIASITSTNPNDKHLSQWKASLEVHAKALRDKLPEAITTEDVLDVLRPIWTLIPETAARTRGRIERVLDAAKVRGLRAGENPARWRGHLALLLPKRQKLYRGHHPALPYSEVAAFMRGLAARAAMSARALEFTILTAARTGEALGARWSEIDLSEKLWTIPAERMKARETHRVPLSPEVVTALQTLLQAQQTAFGAEAASCVSAWKFDPVSGVIGV